MPMIVDPSAPVIEPPVRVMSPDGYLAAVVDEVWAGVALSYDAATPADTARNLVLNPSAVGLTDTQMYGPSITRTEVSTDPRFGATCVQHVHTAASSAGTTWTITPQTAGTTVQVGIWVKVPATGLTGGQITWRNGTTTMRNQALPAVPPGDTWTRITASYTLTAGQTVDRVGVAFVSSASGPTWWADGCMAEAGSTLHPYVDGAQPGCVWEGVVNGSPSRRVTTDMSPQSIRKVRVTRQDPGGGVPVPVRSADPAWAIEGVGTAYDHEPPLGVAVIYTATPIYVDGSTGPTSSLAVTVPAPAPGADLDLWVKSLDSPGLSLRSMIVQWSGPTSAARQDTADIPGSPYRVVAYDEHAAETNTVTIDVPPSQVDQVRRLLRSGVLLMQTRPGYLTPDAYHVPADITGPTPTGKLGSSEGYQFSWTVEPVRRPATAEQPMRLPVWSYDALAERFATSDAAVGSYSTWASLSTDGAT